ncbi:phosphatidylinositol-glycan biosynthesis class S protein [Syncephalis fuscata]|nr:phosphatidylinositol-glycan biosynthesis class S protein [Syncephalis fuscata]
MTSPGPDYVLDTREFVGVKRSLKSQRNVLVMFCVSILLGLPLWWQTTRVYRASLPLEAIDTWSQWKEETNFVFHTKVGLHAVISDSEERQQFKAHQTKWTNQLHGRLQQLSAKPTEESSETSTNNTIIDPVIALQTAVDLHVEVASEGWSLNEVEFEDEMNIQEELLGDYIVYIEPRFDIKHPELIFGANRSVYIRLNNLDVDTVGDVLASILFRDTFLLRSELIQAIDNRAKEQIHNSEMRVIPPARNYQIIFALMNEDPSERLVNWDIQTAISTWLGPFFHRLSPVLNVTLTTQVQHYATLGLQPEERIADTGDVERYLTPEKLGTFINSAEWNLASVVSNDPTIHLLVYAPSPQKGRLYLLDTTNEISKLNAFLIPQWGGIIIENAPKNAAHNENGLELLTVDRLKPDMEVFLSQLRDLLGIRSAHSLLAVNDQWKITAAPSTHYGLSGWELDGLLRWRLGQRIISAVTTLRSLSRMVTTIESMPIEDHIQQRALADLEKTREQLVRGNLVDAFQLATLTAELAEAAFFDHTMVAQLYFPDEHKFAVYMPLFVPIAVPLLLALIRIVKMSKQKLQVFDQTEETTEEIRLKTD